MARAHLDRRAWLHGPSQAAHARAAELHRQDQRASDRIHDPRCRTPLVKFVLVPLLLVYTAILHAYATKIGLERTLPKGTLGNMVVGYLLTGAATLMLTYPIRASGGALVRLFWRSWVWLALMPVLVLFLAAYTRIKAYDLTEERYLIVLIGIWAFILAGLRIWRPVNFDPRLAPAVHRALRLNASSGG